MEIEDGTVWDRSQAGSPPRATLGNWVSVFLNLVPAPFTGLQLLQLKEPNNEVRTFLRHWGLPPPIRLFKMRKKREAILEDRENVGVGGGKQLPYPVD